MMTHIYQAGSNVLVAGKGAIERILKVCRLSPEFLPDIQSTARNEASKGYRVIGVAGGSWKGGPWPESQDDFEWRFLGLVCLYDPPRKNMPEVIGSFYKAGIAVKLLTGDYLETAVNISGQAGIRSGGEYLTGEQVLGMTDGQLAAAAERVSIFARMFPEAKLRVVKTLQANSHVVAMIGDGVNDVPALKISDIGIAMGKKGAEMARQASDLVFTNDRLEKLTEAVQQGRKIFLNLKKSVRYIITIHIPIILTATLPVLLGWQVVNIFTPVHIIFLELIMGPTCSLFFEREPVEADIMRKAPRDRREGILNRHELGIGIMQGLAVTAAILALYFFRMKQQAAVEEIRTEVLTVLLFANIFLTLVNRSFSANIFQTIRYRNNLAPWVLASSAAFITTILLVPAVRNIFGLAPLGIHGLFTCMVLALGSTGWYELYKYFRQRAYLRQLKAPGLS
jgi:Ca2+-transporting ATPase